MKLREILEVLEGELLTDPGQLDRDINCAFGSDLISDILMCTQEPTLLLTGLTNPQIIRMTDMIDVLGIIMVRGKTPPQNIIDMANERDLPIIGTKLTMYKSCGILYNTGLRSCKI